MVFRFRNWARTASCTAAARVFPTSEAEVVALVRDAVRTGQRVKVVGAGHSWSPVACTDGVQVSLDRMARVLAMDVAAGTVVVEAGIRLFQLNAALADHGLAMPVLGSIAQQSVAGAISTGTHGSAPQLGSLASCVASLRLVDGTGEVRDLSAGSEPDLFSAALVGLGALGVITQVTLRVVPAFALEEQVEPLPFEEVANRVNALVASESFVKVWWIPHTTHALVFRYRRTDAKPTWNAFAHGLDEAVVNALVFRALLWVTRWWPRFTRVVNRLVQATYFRPRRRVARSDRAFTLAMPPRHDEAEFALPVEHAAEALRAARDIIGQHGLHVNFIVELRFTAADDAWLSPTHGRASCWLGAYIAESPSRGPYLRHMEAWAMAHGGRPHWGKAFSAGSEELAPRYPKWNAFRAVLQRLDPAGVFRNAFVDRLFPRAP